MTEPTDEQLQAIGTLVIEDAMEIFEKCNAKDDFCIQEYRGYAIVFGGTNRLLWSPIRGFHLDESYCTKRFITFFKNLPYPTLR